MHVYTSVTVNYIPKARVLARSVKKFHPEAQFHLVLSDKIPEWFDLDTELFDSIIHIEELTIPNLKSWIFKHSLVELCTAVKGIAIQEIAKRFDAEKVIYLDPDIVIFSKLDCILSRLDDYGILLTPHQTTPESSYSTIVDNEICSLKHGVFNLGFLAVNVKTEGKRFVDWWANRLAQFCYDDIAGGLFTDQRWVDLAPCFFDSLLAMKEPIYNVCTWNLSNRIISGTLEDGLLVNGQPLCFYHFSGFDSGSQEIMLNKYGGKSPVLKKLRNWYIEECDKVEQKKLGSTPCCYGFFDNGETVTSEQRLLYRSRQDLINHFPDPYSVTDINKSYYAWYLENVGRKEGQSEVRGEPSEMLRAELNATRLELDLIKNSRSWRLVTQLKKFLRPLQG